MWIFTAQGFFSVVQKDREKLLTVRARVAADLDRLRAVVPQLGPTVTTPEADYRYRALIGHADFAAGLAAIARDIDYPNFKAMTGRRLGPVREKVYSQVWEDVWQLQHNVPK